jgi:hypothetical protein
MPYPYTPALIRDWLATNLFTGGGEDRVRVIDGSESPSNLAHAQRFVVVAKSPSSPGDGQMSLDVSDVVIDAYARTEDRALTLAETIRAGLRLQLRHYTDPTSGGFVSSVGTLAPPTLALSESKSWRIATATYRITVHANPA